MKEFLKNKRLIFFLLLLIIIALGIRWLWIQKEYKDITIVISPANPLIKAITSDSSNRLVLKGEVRDKHGNPIFGLPLKFSSQDVGIIYPENSRTNEFGEVLVSFVPPDSVSKDMMERDIRLSVNYGSLESTFLIRLVSVPLVFIHGYQSSSEVFNNMSGYLKTVGFKSDFLDYDSSLGVQEGAQKLEGFLTEEKDNFLSEGIQVGKFDLICHSMGGIVARYYTCSKDYIVHNNVRKIIFISVPHKGSHLAPIGAKYFEDQSIKDMFPESRLFVDLLPNMNNKGLNPTIQVGNIVGRYDEVVTFESSLLDEWGINTEIYDLGDSDFSMDKFSDGDISKFSIHRVILSREQVFKEVSEMLVKNLAYPLFRR